MYNSIEELEKSMRGPASVVPEPIGIEGTVPGNNVNEVLPLPKATHFDDPNSIGLRAPKGAGMVGGKAGDYSGYDELANSIPKPKDTSNQDLLNMGISAAIGAIGGRFGKAATIAGDYGLGRAAKAEKDQSDFENQILKIKALKAAQMAKGQKGVKSSGEDGTKNRYIDSQGNLRTPQQLRENGQWAQLETDPLYHIPVTQNVKTGTPEGGKVDSLLRGTQTTQIGSTRPQLKNVVNAKGETELLNDRTARIQPIGGDFNKTSANLSPKAHTDYKSISDKVNSDPMLRGIEGSYNDMSLGLTALGRGDIAGALAATKMAASSLEKGRMTSDKDLAQVSSINLGLANRMAAMMQSAIEGGKLTEPNRRELESLFSMIEANSRDAHERRLGRFNTEAQGMIGNEWRPDLQFAGLPKFTGKKQESLINTSMKTAKDVMSTGEWVAPLIVKGVPVLDANGNPVKATFIMKDGKPFAIRGAK